MKKVGCIIMGQGIMCRGCAGGVRLIRWRVSIVRRARTCIVRTIRLTGSIQVEWETMTRHRYRM